MSAEVTAMMLSLAKLPEALPDDVAFWLRDVRENLERHLAGPQPPPRAEPEPGAGVKVRVANPKHQHIADVAQQVVAAYTTGNFHFDLSKKLLEAAIQAEMLEQTFLELEADYERVCALMDNKEA